jgi:hypothetical protein
VDVVTIVLQSIALALRVVELFFSQQVGEMQQQVQFDFQVWGMLMFFIRCLEILNIHPALGEVFLIVREMIIDSFAVFFYMLVIAVWAGLALSVGQASGSYQSRYQEPIESRQWRFAGLWAIIGSQRSASSTPTPPLVPYSTLSSTFSAVVCAFAARILSSLTSFTNSRQRTVTDSTGIRFYSTSLICSRA